MDIKAKLKDAHEREDELNRELAKKDAIIRNSERRKLSIARKISRIMKYRNGLVNRLSEIIGVLSDEDV